MTTSVGNGRRAALFMHVVVGDLLTLQIPASVIEINESWGGFASERRVVVPSRPIADIKSVFAVKIEAPKRKRLSKPKPFAPVETAPLRYPRIIQLHQTW
jgi:hypothetical protein